MMKSSFIRAVAYIMLATIQLCVISHTDAIIPEVFSTPLNISTTASTPHVDSTVHTNVPSVTDQNTTTTSTTTPAPNTTTTSTTTTTVAPNTTTTSTTTIAPNTTTTSTTTIAPNTTTTSTTTLAPNTTTTPITTTVAPKTTPKPEPDRKFDGPSFIGGMILTMGLMAIAFVSWKFYKARTERNYHTL